MALIYYTFYLPKVRFIGSVHELSGQPSYICLVCHIFMTSGWLFVLSLYKEDYLKICVRPFDYTAVVVSGKVENWLTGLTTPLGWLLLLQLTVLRRSAIVV